MPKIIEVQNVPYSTAEKWASRFNGLLHGKSLAGTRRHPSSNSFDIVDLRVPTTAEKVVFTTISALGGVAVGFYTFANLIQKIF